MANLQKNIKFYPFLLAFLSPLTHQTFANTPVIPLNINHTSVSQPSLLAEKTIKIAQSQQLAKHLTWRRLLHYPDNAYKFTHSNDIFLNKSRTPTNNQSHSQISDDSFFVSKAGKTDPNAELIAMLEQLFYENSQAVNSVQCRFPARTHWLKQQLNITDGDLPKVNCAETNAWLDKVNPNSAWLIFAEEYLDSPASAFGHSFLRLDNTNTQQAYILNYEPKVTEGEHFLQFSYKSTLAGIDGVFSVLPYEQKIKQYRDDEGRDIWRYQLDLTNDELQQLARQIWEIKDQHPKYLLASDNCASEILLLLNALRPDKNYLQDFNKIVSPADIVRALDKQGVLTKTLYEPSLKSQLQAQINEDKAKNHKVAAFATNLPLLPADNNPQTANPLSVASFAVGQENDNHFIQLGYRGVYHDSLDRQSGYSAGQYLEALSAKLRLFNTTDGKEQHARLEEATLIKARSLNPINTAESQKPWGGNSWGGQLGLMQVSDGFGNNSNRHLVAHIGAEYGWSVAYGLPKSTETMPVETMPVTGDIPPNICYALGTGATQFGKGLEKGYRVGVGATFGCIQQFSNNLRATLTLALPYWYQHNGGKSLNVNNQHGYWQPNANVGLQYDINSRHALRVNTGYLWQPKSRINEKTGQLAYLHYF